jgi:hypothetical protein
VDAVQNPVRRCAVLAGSLVVKTARSLTTLAVIAVAGLFGYYQYSTSSLSRKVDELQQERTRLVEYAQRLSASRRLAQVNVVDQWLDDRGQTASRLLWQEIDHNGIVGIPQTLEVVGTLVYFEAYVIKFEHDLVGTGDPDRGASVAMFRRVFGDRQVPDDVSLFERSSPPLLLETDTSGAVTVAPRDDALWARFWELAENPQLAEQYGIRVAQCEAPAVRLRKGQIWAISLDADGGLNLKRLEAR